MALFNLEKFKNKRAKTLSWGYQRRLSITISLVTHPKILFLDEHALWLDVLARRDLWRIIPKISEKTTIVLTSHYLEEIEALCEDVAILSHGVLKASGSVGEIKKMTSSQSLEDAFIRIIRVIMKLKSLLKKNFYEMLRDSIVYNFCGCISILMILLFAIINHYTAGNSSLFEMKSLIPGITVFSFSFIMLTLSLTISKDMKTSVLRRIYIAPIKVILK